MEKRLRSPNYPAFGLPAAIDKATALYSVQHNHAAPREVVARGMGYNSLNGASATAISALHKYGLLEGRGEQLRVSERALRILHPHSPEERAAAIREAAFDPPLFAELSEKFPGKLPNDDLLRNYLIRRGFAPAAVTGVIAAYRETSEMVDREERAHDSLREQPQEHAAMQPPIAGTSDSSLAHLARPQAGQTPVIAMMEDHFIVSMVVRSRAKARLLKHMIEMAEGMLPEEESAAEDTNRAAVSGGAQNEAVAGAIVDGTQRLATLSLPKRGD